MRMSLTMRVAGIIAVLLLIGCTASDIYPSQVRDMEADKDDFLKFATKCYRQTSKTSRLLQGAIFISERKETSDGKLLIMEAAGSYYNCKLNHDGSVAVTPVMAEAESVTTEAA